MLPSYAHRGTMPSSLPPEADASPGPAAADSADEVEADDRRAAREHVGVTRPAGDRDIVRADMTRRVWRQTGSDESRRHKANGPLPGCPPHPHAGGCLPTAHSRRIRRIRRDRSIT